MNHQNKKQQLTYNAKLDIWNVKSAYYPSMRSFLPNIWPKSETKFHLIVREKRVTYDLVLHVIMCHFRISADWRYREDRYKCTTSMNKESWKLHFSPHTILIASLNVTLNSFNLLAWLLSFLLHACSGGEPSSKSSWVLSKKMINKRKKKPVTTHNRIPCHTLDDSHTFT